MMGEEGTVAPGTPFLNAAEAWAIYDTIQIRTGVTEKEGYASYAALGAAPTWPFFDQRKQDIGIAYTNRDSNEGLEFAFEAYSLGVRFVAPEGIVEPVEAGPLGPDNPKSHMIFSRMIMEHVGFKFKVRQDDKLIHSAYIAPDGLGPGNISSLASNDALSIYDVGSYSNANGDPHISGRWKFPAPIQMPRGSTFSLRMEPSNYCRDLLQVMPGPGAYTFSISGVEGAKAANALIRVDLIGKREVQQRNALHY
jgi:hypothetical protein